MFDRITRHKLFEQLMRDEGTERNAQGSHIAYRCAAQKLTIGYGHNLDANPVPGIGEDSTLTEDQARMLLHKDLAKVEREVETALPWVRDLDAARHAVLVNMAFNMGIRGLLSFNRTLESVKRGEYRDAARRMVASKWVRQVKGRATRLIRQMETGQWQ